MKNIRVKIGTKKEFLELSKLDFTHTYDTMFNVEYEELNIKISEIKLKQLRTNNGSNYSDEIKNFMIPKIENEKIIPLIGFYNDKPVGYIVSQLESWPNGDVIVINGILVAKKYHGKGVAKNMIYKLIEIAKTIKNCRGIQSEMDTTKYQANKLLLKMGFQFAGTKFYIHSNLPPSKYSKEALYFYYKID